MDVIHILDRKFGQLMKGYAMEVLGLHSAKMSMEPVTYKLPWETRVAMRIQIGPGGFFAAHYHEPRVVHAMDECEIYEMVSIDENAILRIFLRDPKHEKYWSHVTLSNFSRYVLIPPGYYHGGLVVGSSSVVFNAHTCVAHTKPGEPDGNVTWLDYKDQPKELLPLVRSLRKRGSD